VFDLASMEATGGNIAGRVETTCPVDFWERGVRGVQV